MCSCGFSLYHSSSLYNLLLLFEDVLRGGCHMILLPACWGLWHGNWLAFLQPDEEHSHIIPKPWLSQFSLEQGLCSSLMSFPPMVFLFAFFSLNRTLNQTSVAPEADREYKWPALWSMATQPWAKMSNPDSASPFRQLSQPLMSWHALELWAEVF